MRIFVMLSLASILGLGGALLAQEKLLFEDFAVMRKNGREAPRDNLWEPTSNPFQKGQIVKLENGNNAYQNEMLQPNPDRNLDNGWYIHFYPNQNLPRYPFPRGFLRDYMLTGDWDPEINRMSFWMRCSKYKPRDTWRTFNVGTYVKPHDYDPRSQGQHYYHHFTPNLYPGRWMKVVVTATPTARVSDRGGTVYPPHPENVNPTLGSPVYYFDGMTRFYISIEPIDNSSFSCEVDEFELWRAVDEPEQEVANIAVAYNGEAYEMAWMGLPSGTKYEVRYSTSSIRESGFEAAEGGNTVRSNNARSAFWKSKKMPEAETMYFAIRPKGMEEFTEVVFTSAPSPDNGPGANNQCDLNGDGQLSVADVQTAVHLARATEDADDSQKAAAWGTVEDSVDWVATRSCPQPGLQ